MTIRRALISVSNKSGVGEFARALHANGIEIFSTGGTANLLRQIGVPVTEVSQYTGSAEMMDGRVKTLHPRVHGGILAQLDRPDHVLAMRANGIEAIDYVIVNLYPFSETIANPDCTREDAIENIDIGGPAMIRSAAKNHERVTVITDPDDYARVAAEIEANGGDTSSELRRELAQKAFAHTAEYDSTIAHYLAGSFAANDMPNAFNIRGTKRQALRYGENPHQAAGFYALPNPPAGSFATFRQLQGKELSYNNIADGDTAWECVKAFETPACVIVKHANPCGVALGATPLEAYQRAFQTDPTSAFGGIVALNRELDGDTAEAILNQFVELIIAPAITPQALERLKSKAAIRVLIIGEGVEANTVEVKTIGGGLLVQTPDVRVVTRDDLKVVTKTQPTQAQFEDLLFAWRVAKFVKSNAIVFVRDRQTLGVGAGQMSRVDSTRIAAIKAENAKLNLSGSVVASDAFFPFRDGVDILAQAGAAAVVQPGGSVRDEEVIQAANEHGVAMVFTGCRHFRH